MNGAHTRRAWSLVSPVYNAIREHPFNRGLARGTLSRQRFQRYLLQDSYYLTAFSRALSLASARAQDRQEMAIFARQASEAIEIERELHRTLFRDFGLDAIAQEPVVPSPACFSYTSHLVALGYQEPYPILLWGLLPCFWIYWEVGKAIRAEHEVARSQGRPPNPYLAWIETYSGDEYAATVSEILEVCERAADRADPALRERMMEAFHRSSVLEWMFWDSAYRLEEWPSF